MISTHLIEKYRSATNKLILLDYDGTLTPLRSLPRQALPPKELFFIEEKKYSIAWHYRNMDSVSGHILSRDLIRTLLSKIKDVKILDGKKVVEIMTVHVGKGQAVLSLIEKNSYDYTLCIGDDVTDEEMFEVLAGNENHFSIKVGQGDTLAEYRLADVGEVLLLLQQL